jgi:hypothetical protein
MPSSTTTRSSISLVIFVAILLALLAWYIGPWH